MTIAATTTGSPSSRTTGARGSRRTPQLPREKENTMRDEAKIKLRESLRGSVIERGAANYDEARALYNGMIDKHPLLIARCVDVADVITSVNFGRDNDLRIAIRGGGHNGPGLASVDDGLGIGLSAMKGVRVDLAARTARGGAGCTPGDR